MKIMMITQQNNIVMILNIMNKMLKKMRKSLDNKLRLKKNKERIIIKIKKLMMMICLVIKNKVKIKKMNKMIFKMIFDYFILFFKINKSFHNPYESAVKSYLRSKNVK